MTNGEMLRTSKAGRSQVKRRNSTVAVGSRTSWIAASTVIQIASHAREWRSRPTTQ